MQTANKPENNNKSHAAHPSLGKALINPEACRMWAESARQDMHTATTATEQHYYEGQVFAFTYIAEVLEKGEY